MNNTKSLQGFQDHLNRRTFLKNTTIGLGGIAFTTLLKPGLLAGTVGKMDAAAKWKGVVDNFHFAPKAKRIIHLCMAGGPSHLETFDFKPVLREMDGKPMPESMTKGQQIAQLQGKELNCKGGTIDFTKSGKSGQMICNAFPYIQQIADDICIVRSMQSEQINHDTAHAFMNTGTTIKGRPSMGSWLLYGLGADTSNLPGYVVLISEGGGQGQPISSRQWHSGFLPSNFQGVQFQAKGAPVHYVNNPPGVNPHAQSEVVETIKELNSYLTEEHYDPEIQTRIAQYEMAFKMQTSVPDLVDVSNEPKHVLEMYGAEPGDGSFASNCLLARRMAERGVRFIQLYHRGWDHHGEVKKNIFKTAKLVDQASAALVTDLKQRGMLDDTLIIWGGEFGRTPMAQGSGRDHHIKAFSTWMAGAGIKPGITYGETDDFGYDVIKDHVSVHDFHATMLHQFGIDHKKLNYRFQGLDFSLTGVFKCRVVHDILS